MQIGLLTTWRTNIGNGFIDKGARAILEQSFPTADIYEIGGYNELAYERVSDGIFSGVGTLLEDVPGISQFQSLKSTIGGATSVSTEDDNDVFTVADAVDLDLAVFSGCILHENGLRTRYQTLKQLSDDGVPILLLGAGGGSYDDATQQTVLRMLEELNIVGMITRDSTAYDLYSPHVPNVTNGIDCAFFIDDWYTPPEATTQFISVTFDTLPEPSVLVDTEVIRLDHEPFGYSQPFLSIVRRLAEYKSKRAFLDKPNALISDLLEDYLFVYANTDHTYSDRIHACVPTLAYGNEATFYYQTPRQGLFDNVVDEYQRGEPIQLDQQQLDRLKQRQIDAVQECV